MKNNYADKHFLKLTGFIHEIRPVKDNMLNIVLSRSGGKKFVSCIIFKDKFEPTGFTLKDRVKIKFTLDAKYIQNYDRWFNSVWIHEIEYWRKNDAKLTKQESFARSAAKKAVEEQSTKPLFNNPDIEI